MAVTANLITLPGLVAGADLSAAQYLFVKFGSTAGQVKPVAASTDAAFGVLQNDPKSGEEAEVAIGGLAKVVAGTSVGWTAGGAVGWNTTGQAVPIALNSTTDNTLIGGIFPLLSGQGTVAAGQIISVQLLPGALRG